MNTLLVEIKKTKAQNITVTEDALIVDLIDGRTISAPAWYTRGA